jgi:deoxyadenosine/deoxycytidine kinase
MKAAYYIAIEGVIGVGKTSLARFMSERLSAGLILEQSEENPYLEDFYRDPQRFAFQLQLFFLISRYRQLLNIPQRDLFHSHLIADYIFAKDRIFAHLNLERRDLILYDKVATLMERELPKPDLVIYLQSSTERLIEHIRRRNRKIERNISTDYIRQLNEAYNSYFFHYKETPLLVVNTSEIDFVQKEADLDDLIRQIENPPAGVKYYVPLKT